MRISIKRFLQLLIILLMIFNITNAQQLSDLSINAGSLNTTVDMYSGRFGVLDMAEGNLDLATALFIGPALSSYIDIRVDEKRQTFDQMEALYPLGRSLGSQIDGIFLAGDQKDIHVEVAYFSMDIKGNSDMNTLGVVISLSNISEVAMHTVASKFMLDTDIGESRNNPLIYLPSGQKINNSFLLTENNIPPYIFLGQLAPLVNYAQGKGFYIYPYISQNMPTAIVIANWRRLSDEQWIPELLAPSLSYESTSSKDAGIALYFGEYKLNPHETVNFGIALSKRRSTLVPLLENKAISEGIFTPDRFEAEEMLRANDPALSKKISSVMNQEKLQNFINQNPINNPYQAQRQSYRRQFLGLTRTNDSFNKNCHDIEFDISMPSSSLWNYLLELNVKMQREEYIISNALYDDINIHQFDSPPAHGIIATNYFR